MAITQRIPVDQALLAEFCRQWKIAKLELFGSGSLPGFGAAAEVGLLVTYCSDADWSLFDHEHMERELSELLGRKVELVSRRAIEASSNALLRSAILNQARSFYAAG
ncbi:MAG TPA: nucleotidyltransferase domain-containing protein [Bryobacteraceae bacterium]|nr:nucleotidyltransferase domain-containing protein [Bryobacteraceae bacterium]